jgi:predicted Zn-dependent peptidase
MERFGKRYNMGWRSYISIRLGKILFNRSNPDYPAMQVVNTVLGGYFGSRLMRNIREDKGYTYGIGSAISSLQQTGYFIIASEVNSKFSQETIQEIKKEIEILQKTLIPEEELKKVKSYMLGQLIRSVDGPFSLSDTYLNIWLQGLDLSYYKKYIKTVKAISTKDIQYLSKKYLEIDSLIEIIAGK